MKFISNIFVYQLGLSIPFFIEVWIEFKGLGNFQLHPTIRVLARFKENIEAMKERLPDVAITGYAAYKIWRLCGIPSNIWNGLSESWEKRSHLVNKPITWHHITNDKPLSWGKISKFAFGISLSVTV